MMYTNQADKELLQLLQKHENLTFQSQLNLQKELNRRNMSEDISALNSLIDKKYIAIAELAHLNDIGFKAEKFEDSIKVTRTVKATVMDVIAIILGMALCVAGIFGITRLIGSFSSENEFSLFSLVINILLIISGKFGIDFLNGIKRLFDYWGFQLMSSNGVIKLRKRFDMKLEEVEKAEDDLSLEKQSNHLVLKLGTEEILRGSNKNIIQAMTVQELFKALKTDV
ncbi:MAG: hypothetical protein COA50_00545 [Flavobacteriaceae bacterium]|nr:MAG: hypothetical protein COA50_00545 [Flavobacteriaceae bacterium]